jgi:ABC-type sugar transport system ATPase subunit
VVIGFRPEALRLQGAEDDPSMPVRIDVVEALGHEIVMHGSIAGRPALAIREDDQALTPLETERAPIVVRMSAKTPLVVGDTIPVRFSVDDAHVFDPATGDVVVRRGERARAPG